jgi:hypothetical protein
MAARRILALVSALSRVSESAAVRKGMSPGVHLTRQRSVYFSCIGRQARVFGIRGRVVLDSSLGQARRDCGKDGEHKRRDAFRPVASLASSDSSGVRA